jgi:hypothetical protein
MVLLPLSPCLPLSSSSQPPFTLPSSFLPSPPSPQVPGGEEAPKVTAGTINTHLDQLRPALTALGGTMEVVDLKQGVCVIKYKVRGARGRGE